MYTNIMNVMFFSHSVSVTGGLWDFSFSCAQYSLWLSHLSSNMLRMDSDTDDGG